MCIVTAKEFQGFISANGLAVTKAGQEWFDMFYPMVIGAIENFLGYKILQTTITEFYPLRSIASMMEADPLSSGVDLAGGLVVPRVVGSRALQTLALTSIPVRSIQSIYENSAAWYAGSVNGDWPTSSLLPSSTYYLDCKSEGISQSGRVHRINGAWSTVPRSIKVTYTAGYSEDEVKVHLPFLRIPVLKALAFNYADAVKKGFQARFGGTVRSVSIEDFSVSIDGNSTGSTSGGASGGDFVTIPEGVLSDLSSHINITKFIRGQ